MADTRIAVGIVALTLSLGSAEAGEEMHVEVVETSAMITVGAAPFITVFTNVILPDGSHAKLICGDRPGDNHCAKIEPALASRWIRPRACASWASSSGRNFRAT